MSLSKTACATYAAEHLVCDGQSVGLGSGSTAARFVQALAHRVQRDRLTLTLTTTSRATADLAAGLGLTTHPLESVPPPDRTFDGADEIDPHFRLIKGGGACLLWEKIVAQSSGQFIVLADAGKRVKTLGAFALPVEVVPFGWTHTLAAIKTVLGHWGVTDPPMARRMATSEPLLTDGGHYIVDVRCGVIPDPDSVCRELNTIAGVVDNGLFPHEATAVVWGFPDGSAAYERRSG